MGRTLAGPGEMGSMADVKKSLKKGQRKVRSIPSEDALTVRFLTEPTGWHGFYQHWGPNGPFPCTTDDCEGCNSDDEEVRRKSFRYLANAFVVDDNKVAAVELPKTLAEQLVGYHGKYKTLLDRDYDLTKTGSEMTGTKYMAAPDSPDRRKLDRFKNKMLDLEQVLQSMLDDDEDDDEDEAPRKSKKSKSEKPKKSKKNVWDDAEERPKKKKKSASRASAKKTVASKKRKVRR